jgi:hypothetical protein
MPGRRRKKPVPVQVAELAMAVPVVVAHRVARMALAGPSPSLRDRREFGRMTAEKIAAFHESWNAMILASFYASQQAATTLVQQMWMPWSVARTRGTAGAVRRTALRVLGKGIAPVHRRAVANARRLGRAKAR